MKIRPSLLLCGLLLAARPALAIDLTGAWAFYIASGAPPGGYPTTMVQTGSALSMTTASGATVTGTIDPDTGVFTMAGGDYLTLTCARFDGTAAADGNYVSGTFSTGTVSCGGPPSFCTCVLSGPPEGFAGCRTGTGLDCCGDRVVGMTEACDDGPEPNGTCCDGTCQPEPAGAPCAADADPCTADVCDAGGTCTHPTEPDSDGDGVCDPNDLCPAGATTSHARIRLHDRLAVRGTLRFDATPAIDPVATGLRLRLEEAGGVAVLDVTVPPGAFDGERGWRAHGRSFRYRATTPVAANVARVAVTVAARTPGEVRVRIQGANGSVTSAEPALPLSATIVLDPTTPAAACGDLRPSCSRRATAIVCR